MNWNHLSVKVIPCTLYLAVFDFCPHHCPVATINELQMRSNDKANFKVQWEFDLQKYWAFMAPVDLHTCQLSSIILIALAKSTEQPTIRMIDSFASFDSHFQSEFCLSNNIRIWYIVLNKSCHTVFQSIVEISFGPQELCCGCIPQTSYIYYIKPPSSVGRSSSPAGPT